MVKKAITGALFIIVLVTLIGCGKEKNVYYSEIKNGIIEKKDSKEDMKGTLLDSDKDLSVKEYDFTYEETNVEDFEYEFDNLREGILIRKYNGADKEVVIPREIEGYPVVSIGTGAFHSTNITIIILPDSLEDIQSKAFLDCKSLRGVEIPEGVTNIYNDAFSRCKELQRVVIDSKTVRIADCAFFDCPKLKRVIFKWTEDSVVLDGSPFYGCPNLDEDSKEAILGRNPNLEWNDKAGFTHRIMRSN